MRDAQGRRDENFKGSCSICFVVTPSRQHDALPFFQNHDIMHKPAKQPRLSSFYSALEWLVDGPGGQQKSTGSGVVGQTGHDGGGGLGGQRCGAGPGSRMGGGEGKRVPDVVGKHKAATGGDPCSHGFGGWSVRGSRHAFSTVSFDPVLLLFCLLLAGRARRSGERCV